MKGKIKIEDNEYYTLSMPGQRELIANTIMNTM